MESIRGWYGGGDRRKVPLPKGNTYFSHDTSSLVYSGMSPFVCPLHPSQQSLPSPLRLVARVRLFGTVFSRGACLGDSPSPQPHVLGFVLHDPLV